MLSLYCYGLFVFREKAIQLVQLSDMISLFDMVQYIYIENVD